MLPRTGVQIILFSATFPDHVRNFAAKFAPNANKIELQKNEVTVDNIRQCYMDCKNEEHKYDVLVSLYHLLTIGQSIIFCQVRTSLSPGRGQFIRVYIAPTHCGPDRTTHDGRGAQGRIAARREGCLGA